MGWASMVESETDSNGSHVVKVFGSHWTLHTHDNFKTQLCAVQKSKTHLAYSVIAQKNILHTI